MTSEKPSDICISCSLTIIAIISKCKTALTEQGLSGLVRLIKRGIGWRLSIIIDKIGRVIYPRDDKKEVLIDSFLSVPNKIASGQNKKVTITKGSKKIVGLVPGRNEAKRIAFCLRALAKFTDGIVYLDDCSDDETVQVVNSLASDCRVEKIIRKTEWYRDEPGDRNALLQAGREIGGTHFIVIDADEAITANCAENDVLRRIIYGLKPGDRMALNWIQLWRSVHNYRFDKSIYTGNYKDVIFCDDGKCYYDSAFIHTPRTPNNLSGIVYKIGGYSHGLLHFQFVNWRELLIKQAWYRCLERIRQQNKSARAINKMYAPTKDETNLGLKPAPPEWFEKYEFFNETTFTTPDRWREAQVLEWFEKYGSDYFADLDIWDIDWGKGLEVSGQINYPHRWIINQQ